MGAKRKGSEACVQPTADCGIVPIICCPSRLEGGILYPASTRRGHRRDPAHKMQAEVFMSLPGVGLRASGCLFLTQGQRCRDGDGPVCPGPGAQATGGEGSRPRWVRRVTEVMCAVGSHRVGAGGGCCLNLEHNLTDARPLLGALLLSSVTLHVQAAACGPPQ